MPGGHGGRGRTEALHGLDGPLSCWGMAIEQRFCTNHPQRPAIGVCVMTRRPICSECSTRYEGVNYSKEGLRLLQEQRAAQRNKSGKGAAGVTALLMWGSSPVLLYMMYLWYLATANVLMSWLRGGD